MDADPLTTRRLDAIARLRLLERAGDPGVTALTRLAAHVAHAPAAAVHVLDEVYQHRVAATGAPLGPHPRGDSLCRLVVDGEREIVSADATLDPRFAYSSFVAGPTPVRFYASMPLRTLDGTIIGTLCAWDVEARELTDAEHALFGDLAEQAAIRIELQRVANELGHAATHDPLTGALNRLVLSDRIAHALARRLRHGGDVLVALVDLDDFKAINDELGHVAGDEALVAVAHRLRSAVRAEDTVARLGGDEFAVVAELPSGDPSAAQQVVARLEAALAPPAHFGGADRPLPAALGAALVQPGDDATAALERADRAMYARKAERQSAAR